MTLTPFLSAPFEIQVHMVCAIIGLSLGPFVLYRSRRDRVHKVLGYVWVSAMAVLAISSFAIPSFFTPIGIGPLHLFAMITLWSLWTGVRYAIQRDFDAHQAVFRSLYTNGLIIAGAFTFLPGRTINQMVFGEPSHLGWLVIAGLLGLVAIRVFGPRIGFGLRT
ncbi:DUF2306 domain-containing protein [Marivita sp. S6314]|uniref:DUF2306 domain-containing protein n=1 Tax=Marivita sp. S6314 TaxID=2926406 RepID=UPI001FF22918|nr:DUF2306 domain-containing protein [Marivita sp. S6314]MCK0149345.1 DUF2306 domain-containing protein [Marivita sp. S6314]